MDSRAPGTPPRRSSALPSKRCLAHETIFRNGEIILKPTAVYQGSLVLAGVQDEFDGRGRSSTSWVMQRGHLSGARCRGLQHPVDAPLGGSEDRCLVQSVASCDLPAPGPVRIIRTRTPLWNAPATAPATTRLPAALGQASKSFFFRSCLGWSAKTRGADSDAFRLLRLRGMKQRNPNNITQPS